jgi:hypothetical protein
MKIDFYQSQWIRVSRNFNRAKHKGFIDKNEFADWYVSELKKHDCKCYYCETSIHDIIELINEGLLKTRSVRGKGKRGPVLEIDKNDDSYTKEHCVLSCYYCNNDKSYTTTLDDYKEFFGKNRKRYFDHLLKLINR